MIRFFIPLTIVFLLMSACGPSSSPSGRGNQIPSFEDQQKKKYEEVDKPQFVVFGEAERTADKFQFDCPDCPLSIGQLITMTVDGTKTKPKHDTGNCQGAMIREGLFLTNRHCIPKDLLEVDARCKGRMKVIMPGHSKKDPPSILPCEKVKAFSKIHPGLKETASQPDWAILEVDSAFGIPLNSEPETIGITDEEKLYGFVPLNNQQTGRFEIQKIECTAKQNSLAVPSYNSDLSPIVFLKCNKDITLGFSGTVLFEKNEEGYAPKATLSNIWHTQAKEGDEGKLLVSDKVVASNLSCISEGELPEGCEFNPKKKKQLKEDLVIEVINKVAPKIHEFYDPIMADHAVEWEEIPELKKGKVTTEILKAWKHVKNLPKNFLKTRGRAHLFSSMVLITPICLKKSHIPQSGGKAPTTVMPSVAMWVERDNDRRPVVKFKTFKTPVNIVAKNKGYYGFVPTGKTPDLSSPKNIIISSGFNHFDSSIKACD